MRFEEIGPSVTINAGHTEISFGILTVNTGVANFSGVVKCDTLISNGVFSASYSQVGNIW
jgi:hypothetical protein